MNGESTKRYVLNNKESINSLIKHYEKLVNNYIYYVYQYGKEDSLLLKDKLISFINSNNKPLFILNKKVTNDLFTNYDHLFDNIKKNNNINSIQGLICSRKIKISSAILIDINPISEFINLINITIEGCLKLTDISPIITLINLEYIDINGCFKLTDINCISKLIHLKLLNLSGCKNITNINSLKYLHELKTLGINYCESIIDLSSISNLINLQKLYMKKCNKDIKLSILDNLNSLKIYR